MAESQYARYKDLPRESLGIMSNQLWLEDPKMLGIHLARYKFVAKMLTGKQRVAEVGCGDGFYSRVVSQEVPKLYLFDFDPALFSEIKDSKGVVAFHHDILAGNLPFKPFDAVYSLDVMEHIKPEDEDAYLTHIKGSLKPDGVFIVGMPSLESQVYASEASKAGHVNCLSGKDLKEKLEGHFQNVFLFGMHDETISTAFLPMCHYLLGICCGVR